MDTNQNTVTFRDVPEFPGYRVGSDGSVWSRWRKTSHGYGGGTYYVIGDEWKDLRLVNIKGGYKQITLCRDKSHHRFKVHRLILTVFVGPCPSGMECLHGDGNPANNSLVNIRWGTRVENASDTKRHGRHWTPFARPSKVSRAIQDEIRRRYRNGESTRRLAREYGIGKSLAHLIASGVGVYSGRNDGEAECCD